MNKRLRWFLVVGLTFVVIIAIFWFVLPVTGLPALFGSSYFMVSLVASLLISIFVSRALSRMIK